MEPIDAGDMPLDKVIEEIFTEDGLRGLLGGYRTACFVLARSGLQVRFYQDLIENIDTVDATTRDHIAFVVFHGSRSSYIRDRAGMYYSYHLDGLSLSTERKREQPREWMHDTGFPSAFRSRLKEEPHKAPFEHIGRASDYATTLLMDRFGIRETALPCLLFLERSNLQLSPGRRAERNSSHTPHLTRVCRHQQYILPGNSRCVHHASRTTRYQGNPRDRMKSAIASPRIS
jgi:hypothetical protein